MRILFLTLICLYTAFGAEITLKDGNTLYGEIVTEDENAVVIDGIFGTKRSSIRCERKDIASIKPGHVPKGYFDDVSPERDESTAKHDYLLVPIHGVFGEDVHAAAIKKIMIYAKRHRLKHIVFDINMDEDGDLDEAIACIQQVIKYKKGLTIHASVHQALGNSIGLLVLADNIYVYEKTVIGGLFPTPMEQEDPSYMTARHALGMKAAQFAQDHGKGGQVIRAMVDPEMRLTAWFNNEQKIEMSSEEVPAMAAEQTVFRCEPGTLLQLNKDQLQSLGAPSIKDVSEINTHLNLPRWVGTDVYAKKVIAQIAESENKRKNSTNKLTERKIEKCLSRREQINEALQHNILMASQWDPSKASYSTYQASWSYNRRLNNGRRRYVGNNDVYGTYDTRQMTQDSKNRWRQHSDITAKYLSEAKKSIKSMKDIEKKTERLGIERLYTEVKLKQMYDDIHTKHEFIVKNRNRKEM